MNVLLCHTQDFTVVRLRLFKERKVIMYEELEYEFADFKHSFDEGSLVFGRWFDEDEYEDEYSHNEIDEYQEKFIERVKEYLHEKAPNKYVVTSGWCVFVMTVEEAKKRNMLHIEECTVR